MTKVFQANERSDDWINDLITNLDEPHRRLKSISRQQVSNLILTGRKHSNEAIKDRRGMHSALSSSMNGEQDKNLRPKPIRSQL